MDLVHKVIIIKDDASRKEVEDCLNDGFVFLRADRMGENVLATLAKAVKGKPVASAPGEKSVVSPIQRGDVGKK